MFRALLLAAAALGVWTGPAALFAAEGTLDRALLLYNRTDYAGAIAQLKGAAQDARSLELLGQSLFMQGDYKRATDTLERAAALDPGDSMIHTWLGRAFGRRAETSFPVTALGYAQRTREEFEKAVQLDGKNGEAVNDLFEFYLQAPALVGGGVDKARNLISVISQIDPVEAHFARARLAEERKQLDVAETHYRKAIELAPQQVGRVLDLAKFLSKRARFDESDQLFEKAEKSSPGNPKVWYARAQSYVRAQRKLDDAQVLLRKFLAASNLTPEDPSRADAQKLLKKAQGV